VGRLTTTDDVLELGLLQPCTDITEVDPPAAPLPPPAAPLLLPATAVVAAAEADAEDGDPAADDLWPADADGMSQLL